MNLHQKIIRGIYYVLGLIVLALGLTLNAKTGLGVSPITALPYTVSEILHLNFGNMVFVLYLIFIAVELLLKKRWADRFLVVLQIPLSLVFTQVMNIFSGLLDLRLEVFWQQLLLLFCAILCTGIGAAMTMNMHLVPNPGDGIVQTISEFSDREIGMVKNCVDLANVLSAVLVGCLVREPLLGVGLGTVLAVLGIGRVITLFNHFFQVRMQTQAGLS